MPIRTLGGPASRGSVSEISAAISRNLLEALWRRLRIAIDDPGGVLQKSDFLIPCTHEPESDGHGSRSQFFRVPQSGSLWRGDFRNPPWRRGGRPTRTGRAQPSAHFARPRQVPGTDGVAGRSVRQRSGGDSSRAASTWRIPVAYLIDTSIFIAVERSGGALSDLLKELGADEPVALSAITASELLHGVHRADSAVRRGRREEFRSEERR